MLSGMKLCPARCKASQTSEVRRSNAAQDSAWTAQGSACLYERGIVRCEDVAAEEAEMDEIEAFLGKECGGDVVHFRGEKGDLRQTIPVGQGVGRFHQEVILLDADALQVGIWLREGAQPYPDPAANFQDGACARQIALL